MIPSCSGTLLTLYAAGMVCLMSCRAGCFKTVVTNATTAATAKKRKMTDTKRKASRGRRLLFRRDSMSMSASRLAVILESGVWFSEIASRFQTPSDPNSGVRCSSGGKALYAVCEDHVGLFIAKSNDHTLSDTLEKRGSHGFPSRLLTHAPPNLAACT